MPNPSAPGVTHRPVGQTINFAQRVASPTVRDPKRFAEDQAVIQEYQRQQTSTTRREETPKKKPPTWKKILGSKPAKLAGKALQYTSLSEGATKIPGIGDDIEAGMEYIPGVREALAVGTNVPAWLLAIPTGGTSLAATAGVVGASAVGTGLATNLVSDDKRGMGVDIAGVPEKYEEALAGAAGGIVGGAGATIATRQAAQRAALSAETNLKRISSGKLDAGDVLHTADGQTFTANRTTSQMLPDDPSWSAVQIKNPKGMEYNPDSMSYRLLPEDEAALRTQLTNAQVDNVMDAADNPIFDVVSVGRKPKKINLDGEVPSTIGRIGSRLDSIVENSVPIPGFKTVYRGAKAVDKGIGQAAARLAPEALKPAVGALARPSTLAAGFAVTHPEETINAIKKAFEVDHEVGLQVSQALLPKTDWNVNVPNWVPIAKDTVGVNLEGAGAELFRPSNFISFTPMGTAGRAGMAFAKGANLAALGVTRKAAVGALGETFIREGVGNAVIAAADAWTQGADKEGIIAAMLMGFGAGAALGGGMQTGWAGTVGPGRTADDARVAAHKNEVMAPVINMIRQAPDADDAMGAVFAMKQSVDQTPEGELVPADPNAAAVETDLTTPKAGTVDETPDLLSPLFEMGDTIPGTPFKIINNDSTYNSITYALSEEPSVAQLVAQFGRTADAMKAVLQRIGLGPEDTTFDYAGIGVLTYTDGSSFSRLAGYFNHGRIVNDPVVTLSSSRRILEEARVITDDFDDDILPDVKRIFGENPTVAEIWAYRNTATIFHEAAHRLVLGHDEKNFLQVLAQMREVGADDFDALALEQANMFRQWEQDGTLQRWENLTNESRAIDDTNRAAAAGEAGVGQDNLQRPITGNGVSGNARLDDTGGLLEPDGAVGTELAGDLSEVPARSATDGLDAGADRGANTTEDVGATGDSGSDLNTQVKILEAKANQLTGQITDANNRGDLDAVEFLQTQLDETNMDLEIQRDMLGAIEEENLPLEVVVNDAQVSTIPAERGKLPRDTSFWLSPEGQVYYDASGNLIHGEIIESLEFPNNSTATAHPWDTVMVKGWVRGQYNDSGLSVQAVNKEAIDRVAALVEDPNTPVYYDIGIEDMDITQGYLERALKNELLPEDGDFKLPETSGSTTVGELLGNDALPTEVKAPTAIDQTQAMINRNASAIEDPTMQDRYKNWMRQGAQEEDLGPQGRALIDYLAKPNANQTAMDLLNPGPEDYITFRFKDEALFGNDTNEIKAKGLENFLSNQAMTMDDIIIEGVRDATDPEAKIRIRFKDTEKFGYDAYIDIKQGELDSVLERNLATRDDVEIMDRPLTSEEKANIARIEKQEAERQKRNQEFEKDGIEVLANDVVRAPLKKGIPEDKAFFIDLENDQIFYNSMYRDVHPQLIHAIPGAARHYDDQLTKPGWIRGIRGDADTITLQAESMDTIREFAEKHLKNEPDTIVYYETSNRMVDITYGDLKSSISDGNAPENAGKITVLELTSGNFDDPAVLQARIEEIDQAISTEQTALDDLRLQQEEAGRLEDSTKNKQLLAKIEEKKSAIASLNQEKETFSGYLRGEAVHPEVQKLTELKLRNYIDDSIAETARQIKKTKQEIRNAYDNEDQQNILYSQLSKLNNELDVKTNLKNRVGVSQRVIDSGRIAEIVGDEPFHGTSIEELERLIDQNKIDRKTIGDKLGNLSDQRYEGVHNTFKIQEIDAEMDALNLQYEKLVNEQNTLIDRKDFLENWEYPVTKLGAMTNPRLADMVFKEMEFRFKNNLENAAAETPGAEVAGNYVIDPTNIDDPAVADRYRNWMRQGAQEEDITPTKAKPVVNRIGVSPANAMADPIAPKPKPPLKSNDVFDVLEDYRGSKVNIDKAGIGDAFSRLQTKFEKDQLAQPLRDIDTIINSELTDDKLRKISQNLSESKVGRFMVEMLGGKAATAKSQYDKSVVAYRMLLEEGASQTFATMNWLRQKKSPFDQIVDPKAKYNSVRILNKDGKLVMADMDDVLSNPSQYTLNENQRAFVTATHKIIDDLVGMMQAKGIDIKQLGIEKRGEHYIPRFAKGKDGFSLEDIHGYDRPYAKKGVGAKQSFQRGRVYGSRADGAAQGGIQYSHTMEALEGFVDAAYKTLAARELMTALEGYGFSPKEWVLRQTGSVDINTTLDAYTRSVDRLEKTLGDPKSTPEMIAKAQESVDKAQARLDKENGGTVKRIFAPLYGAVAELKKVRKSEKGIARELEAARRKKGKSEVGANRKKSNTEVYAAARKDPEVMALDKAITDAKAQQKYKDWTKGLTRDERKVVNAWDRARNQYDSILAQIKSSDTDAVTYSPTGKPSITRIGDTGKVKPSKKVQVSKEQLQGAYNEMVAARKEVADLAKSKGAEDINALRSLKSEKLNSVVGSLRKENEFVRQAGIQPNIDRIKDLELKLSEAKAKTAEAQLHVQKVRGNMSSMMERARNLQDADVEAFAAANDIMEISRDGKVPVRMLRNLPGLNGKWFPSDVAESIEKITNDKGFTGLEPVVAVNDWSRLARTSTDAGFLMIQGLPVLMRNPKAFWNAMAVSIKSMIDPESYARFLADKQSVLNSGLPYLGAFSGSDYFTAAKGSRIKQAAARQATNPVAAVEKGAGQAIQRFAVGFESFVDAAKLYMWEGMEPHLKTEAQKASYGRLLRNMTGTTSTARMGVGAGQRQIEALLMFSPRFTRSIFALTGQAMQGDKNAIASIASMLVGSAVLYAGVKTAMYQQGLTDEPFSVDDLDPRKGGRFMSIKVGDNYVGLGGSFRSGVQLLGYSLAAAAEPERFLSTDSTSNDKSNPFLKYARGRLSPIAGNVYDIIDGETILGEDARDREAWLQKMPDNFLPFAASAWADTQGGTNDKMGILAAQFTGFRSFPESPNEDLDAIVAEKMIGEGVAKWGDLTAYQKATFLDENPEAQELVDKRDLANWNQYKDLSIHATAAKKALGERWLQTQTQSGGEKLNPEDLTSKEYREEIGRINDQLKAARAVMSGGDPFTGLGGEFDQPAHTMRQKLMKEFYTYVSKDKYTRADGTIDYDVRESLENQFRAQLDPEMNAIIDEETLGSVQDPVEKRLQQSRQQIGQYFDISDAVAQSLGYNSQLEIEQAPEWVQKKYNKLEKATKERWREANPEADKLMAIWGYVSKTMDEREPSTTSRKVNRKVNRSVTKDRKINRI